ncbi:MAG: minor capsid protein [Clostridia bacterium]|nr:minor capsid protein [Clostridia bacterium]
MEVLSNLLDASTLQMKNYMLLWDYQDAGFTHYCLLTEGENCDDCNSLEGQVFPISEARVGENFPPMHPNCNCHVGILDKENKVIVTIGEGEEQAIEPDDKDNQNWLDSISNLLTAASLVPGLDSLTNLASIPVDLARGDFLSAGLSAIGMVPVVGEVADTAKLAKMADKVVGAAKVNKTAKNSELIIKVTNKSSALKSVDTLPSSIQKSAKSFFKGSSNNYNSYSVIKNKNNTYTIKMENPGKVPGSKAVYNKIVNSDGKTIKVYKDTFDPSGNLVHRKDK